VVERTRNAGAIPPDILQNGIYPVRGYRHALDVPKPPLSSVFSTKERASLISATWRPRLHQYLGGAVNGLGGESEGVGGTADHVHILVELRATHVLADFMRELKKGSSKWVHEEISQKNFAWQEGYAAFSVSASAVDTSKIKKSIIGNGASARN
jgi:REP element-mobilizing transposase RayT